MAIETLPQFTTNVRNVAALADKPTETAAQIKAIMDKGNVDTQDFINATLLLLDTYLALLLPKTDVVNDLTTGGTTKALSAEQGKTLKTAVDLKVAISTIVNDLTTGGTTVPLSAEQGKTLQTSKQKAITSGTADITGGSDGDIYLQYV